MGANNIKTATDAHAESPKEPSSSALYKPHLSPTSSPTRDHFYTPAGSPEQKPAGSGSSPEQLPLNFELSKGEEAWGVPFSRAMERIQHASDALARMHSQLGALLSPRMISEGPHIMDSALGWEARLAEVRQDLSVGLKEMRCLKDKYEALSAGAKCRRGQETGRARDNQAARECRERLNVTECLTTQLQTDFQAMQDDSESAEKHERRQKEERAQKEKLQDRIYQLEKEKETLTENLMELKTAVSVAERFREEAQEKLEKAETENRRLRSKRYDSVDWADAPPVNGSLQGYHSLPRGVILSSLRDPIMKSSSLMSVPPSQRPPQETGSVSRRERRGSLETLLNESKATENLTEDSGSFFRRYGGSKRGVFLRWAQDRTCGYKHVVITNFSSSWADGMALCALLHSYLPERIPYTQLRPLEKRRNLQLALQVAESAGIPSLLTPDHMLQPQGPDWQKVLLYVESIYQKFEA
ncbi:smoothelin-like protein 1 isoform X2 [Spea bombifrons]|uniref:smoothelin-like protein 1 isoform X2 n=1 Tax=Spea bombifrons TaxID=233779 RepID=UPI0023493246|nr:smoothelin-like protein 1 isoform X2 [Spea bombifrons]